MTFDSALNQERLKQSYYKALGKKVPVEVSVLLPGHFPNDGNYATKYDDFMVGILLENLNIGDQSKKKKIGDQRIDIWFTYVKKEEGDSVLDSQLTSYDKTPFLFVSFFYCILFAFICFTCLTTFFHTFSCYTTPSKLVTRLFFSTIFLFFFQILQIQICKRSKQR